jgi:ferrous iron transport protein A
MRDIETMTHKGTAIHGGPATRSCRLGSLRRGARGTIVGIVPPPARAADAIDPAELERRLLEMGFVEGAHVEILHEGPIGADPIAVKVDETRVALRRRDADALVIDAQQECRAA